MENSFESYRKEFEPWLGTLVMFPLWSYQTVRLVDVVQEDFKGRPEWYYVVEDEYEKVTKICTGLINGFFFKKEVSEDIYERLIACWNRNKIIKAI